MLCSGKVGHEALAKRDALAAPATVARVEQLYPWPDAEIADVLDRYPDTAEIVWLQDEPRNMALEFRPEPPGRGARRSPRALREPSRVGKPRHRVAPDPRPGAGAAAQRRLRLGRCDRDADDLKEFREPGRLTG